MKKTPSAPKLIGTSAIVALVVLAWVNFGPRQLGGSVSYVMTHGISMEPRVHEGDLVLLREADTYQPGDVIAYNSAALQQPVMHRIVNKEGDGYVTKGDNNDWLDIDRPTDADVIGTEWVHIPKAGKLLALLAVPRNAAALAGAAGLFLFGGTKKRKGRRRGSEAPTMQTMNVANFQRLDPVRQCTLGMVAFAALVALLLGVLGFTKQSVTAVSQESAYSHQGSFAYAADARETAVYPDGQANTRGPLFLKLIDDIRFTFSYTLGSEAERNVGGTAALRARINDDSGWQTTLPLQQPTRFRGSQVQVSGDLDPKEVHKLTTEVQSLTGIAGSYTVTIVPVVEVKGTVGGEPITETFQPELPFALDGLQMTAAAVDAGAGEADPFKPSKPGSIKISDIAENRIFIGPLSMTVPAARKFSVLGLGLALLLAFSLWRLFSRSLDADEVSEIQARYGTWLVPVTEITSTADKQVRVADIDGLVRLADRYERMVLHAHRDGVHSYVVQESGVDYIFQVGSPSTSSTSEEVPAVRPPTQLREQRRKNERDELREHLKKQVRELDQEIATKETSTRPEGG